MLLRLSPCLCVGFLLLLVSSLTHAQFKCTFSGTDESSCLDATDGSDHCAWCTISALSFCASEEQAEQMEEQIPGASCDHYKGSDDDAAASDDEASVDDDVTPTPTDDAIPDDYWTCLEANSDAKSCSAAECTWCVAKAGFGLCLTGPSAESAQDSDWFDCGSEETSSHSIRGAAAKTATLIEVDNTTLEDKVEDIDEEDPYDPSCVMAYLQDPSEEGCSSAVDADGTACEYCSLQGQLNMCLTEEQAAVGEQIGMDCGKSVVEENSIQDPYDPSCVMAYLQDPTAEGCSSAADADGGACEYCSLQGQLNMCLTEEQAAVGEQIGMQCGENAATLSETAQDPYDTACVLAYLQDPTEEGCLAAVDSDGSPCEYCDLQGMANFCLTEEEGNKAAHLGVTCDSKADSAASIAEKENDPYDPSCVVAYLQDPTADGCTSAVDADGAACEYCSLQGQLNLCLTAEQAAMGEQIGMDCGDTSSIIRVATE